MKKRVRWVLFALIVIILADYWIDRVEAPVILIFLFCFNEGYNGSKYSLLYTFILGSSLFISNSLFLETGIKTPSYDFYKSFLAYLPALIGLCAGILRGKHDRIISRNSDQYFE